MNKQTSNFNDYIAPEWRNNKLVLRPGSFGTHTGHVAINFGPIEEIIKALSKANPNTTISLLFMVKSGSVRGAWRKKLTIGEMAQVDLPIKHKRNKLTSSSDASCLCLGISGSFATALQRIEFWQPHPKPGPVVSSIAAIQRFQNLGHQLERHKKLPPDFILQLSTYIQSWYNDWYGDGDRDDLVDRACQILIASMYELSDGQLAEQLSVTPRLLHRRFKQLLGVTPSDFQRKQRISRAISLLDAGKTVRECAEQLGFSDASNFSKAFKRITGVAPSNYYNINA